METIMDASHAERLRQCLRHLCHNKHLCDVVLRSSDGQDIQAHWLVLASSSEFFASQTYTPIIYTDMDMEALSVLVEYIYTGQINVTSHSKDKIIVGSENLKLSSLVELLKDASQSDQRENEQTSVSSDSGTLSGICIGSELSLRGSSQKEPRQAVRSDGAVMFGSGETNTREIETNVSKQTSGRSLLAHSFVSSGQVSKTEVTSVKSFQESCSAETLIENVDFQIKEEVDVMDDDDESVLKNDLEDDTDLQLTLSDVQDPSSLELGPSIQVSQIGELFTVHKSSPGEKRKTRERRGRRRVRPGAVPETVVTGDVAAEEEGEVNTTDEPTLKFGKLSRKPTFHLCSSCGLHFKSISSLRQHQRLKHEGSATYTCDICQKQFMSCSLFEGHRNHHLGIKPHLCATCGKTFAYKSNMATHSKHCSPRAKAPVREVRCPFCDRGFKLRKYLNDHLKGHHSNDKRWYQCPCGTKFKWRSSLHYHKTRKCDFLKRSHFLVDTQ